MQARIETCSAEPSRHHFIDDFAGYVGEAEVAALETISELEVVDAKQVQQRRLQVVNVDRIFDDPPANVVGLADHLASLDAAPRAPQAEGKRMMVAAVDG